MDDSNLIYVLDRLEQIVKALHPPMSEGNRLGIKLARYGMIVLIFISFLLFKSCQR